MADSGVGSLIPVRSYTLVEIDHEIFSTIILLIPLVQEGLVSVTSESMWKEYWLTALKKSVVRLTDRLDITIAVD